MSAKKWIVVLCTAVFALGAMGLSPASADQKAITAMIDSLNTMYESLDEATAQVSQLRSDFEKEQALYNQLRSLFEKTRNSRIGALMMESGLRLDAIKNQLGIAQADVQAIQEEIRGALSQAQMLVAVELKGLNGLKFEEQANYDRLRSQFEKTGDMRIARQMKETAARIDDLDKQIEDMGRIAAWIDHRIREAQTWDGVLTQ